MRPQVCNFWHRVTEGYVLDHVVVVVVRAHSHCAFFLIATAILLIATNGLHRTQWNCSHYVTATTLPTPIQPIMSKNKSQSQIAQCEWALNIRISLNAFHLKPAEIILQNVVSMCVPRRILVSSDLINTTLFLMSCRFVFYKIVCWHPRLRKVMDPPLQS